MERKLSQLFDRQRFQQTDRLGSIIGEVESRYAASVADDDLELVSAAGDLLDHVIMQIIPERLPKEKQP